MPSQIIHTYLEFINTNYFRFQFCIAMQLAGNEKEFPKELKYFNNKNPISPSHREHDAEQKFLHKTAKVLQDSGRQPSASQTSWF